MSSFFNFSEAQMTFKDLFRDPKPLIACIHLMPLPGSPRYSGKMTEVYDTALSEVAIFRRYPIDGLIVENFRDMPFYPNKLDPETIAAMAAVTREIVNVVDIPVGVNALRNDALAAIAIANATEANFIRVNVHMGAVVSDQGIIEGAAHKTLRLRSNLKSEALVFADVGVKHSAPLGRRGLAAETRDLTERGLADAIIVSGDSTGSETQTEDIDIVGQNTYLPILVGSGVTRKNLGEIYPNVDGFIVGSTFKKDGKTDNFVEEKRVKGFTKKLKSLKT